VDRTGAEEVIADEATEFVGDGTVGLERPDAEGPPGRVIDVDAGGLLLAIAHGRAPRGLSASTRRTRVQVCVGPGGLTRVRLTAFAGVIRGVAAFGHRDRRGGRSACFGVVPSTEGVIATAAILELVSEVDAARALVVVVARGLGLAGAADESVEVVLGDPDRSADADARDGTLRDQFVELRGGRVESLGGLGDGQQARWGCGGRSRHRGLLDRRRVAGLGAELRLCPRSLVHASLATGSRPQATARRAPGPRRSRARESSVSAASRIS
jgi:hypothetical protein